MSRSGTRPRAPAAQQQEVRLSRRQVWITFFGLILGILLAALDGSVVSTALPTIVGELNGLDKISWIITAYLLAQTITMPIYGKLGDLFGRKRLFHGAIVLFLVGSALCGLAQSMNQLIAFRAVQGLGAGGLMVGAQSIIGEITSPRERGRYMSVMAPMIGVATVAGPLVGGFFTEHVSWRWIFYINIPVGAFALLVTGLVLKLPRRDVKPRIDYLGTMLLAGAVACAVLLTSWGGTEYGWTSNTILGLAAGAVALTVTWILAERRAAEPIIPLGLFRDRVFVVCVLLGLVVGFAMLGSVNYIPTFLQIVTGASATNSGLLMLPFMAGMMSASVTVGQVMSRTGRYKFFTLIGPVVSAAGMYLLSRMGIATTRVEAGIFMVVVGLGIGMVMPVLTTVVQNSVKRHNLGSATSSVNFFRQLGGSFGVAIFGALFTSRLQDRLTEQLTPAMVARAGEDAGSVTPQVLHQMPAAMQEVYIHSYADALPPVFICFVPLLLTGFVIAWFLEEKPLAAQANVGGGPGGRQPGAGETAQPPLAVETRPAGVHAHTEPTPAAAAPNGHIDGHRPGRHALNGDGTHRAVRGRVYQTDGSPLLGVALTMLDFSGQEIDRTRSGDDGVYTLTAPATGSYVVVAVTGEHRPDISTISIGGGPVVHEITLGTDT